MFSYASITFSSDFKMLKFLVIESQFLFFNFSVWFNSLKNQNLLMIEVLAVYGYYYYYCKYFSKAFELPPVDGVSVCSHKRANEILSSLSKC